VNRTTATASGINTAFTGIPLNYSDASELSEFYGTGRQSRIALTAQGKLANMTLTGHWEADWLSAGADSNNNQSNSYTMRQRVLYGEAKMNSGWDVSAGTGWDLVAETTQGLQRGTEILPATIDAQYEAGFAWTRQFSFRFTKNIGQHVFAGFSVENAETLNPGGQNLPSNVLIGSAGAGGGHFNAGANYSFNYAPDLVAKIAVEPGWVTGSSSASSAPSVTASIRRLARPIIQRRRRGRGRRLSRTARRQESDYLPEGAVWPGCGPLWFVDHRRHHLAPGWLDLAAAWLLGSRRYSAGSD